MSRQENIQGVLRFPIKAADLKVNRYSLLAHIYFFFNAVLLPQGLLYTTLLGPLFFYRALKRRCKTYLLHFGIFLAIYDCIHLYIGVNVHYFMLSNALFIFTYFSVIGIYHFVRNYNGLEKIYRQILLFNALMLLIAIPFFFMPGPYRETFWYVNKLTAGFTNFPRLALLTYEASYYSLLLIPVFYYYMLKFMSGTISSHKWLTVALIVLPMLLSFSFGVLGTTFLTALLMALVFSKKLFTYKRTFTVVFSILAALLLAAAALAIFFPENVLFARLKNIVTGNDSSGNGRTVESIGIGIRMAAEKNIFFGAGLGQVKLLIGGIIRGHYDWDIHARHDIPNAVGETIAIFGLLGLCIRLFLEIWLFFKTRVYVNYYRLALFIFVFIYQFTGSYITNIAEYMVWILAFSQVFRQFDIRTNTTAEHV